MGGGAGGWKVLKSWVGVSFYIFGNSKKTWCQPFAPPAPQNGSKTPRDQMFILFSIDFRRSLVRSCQFFDLILTNLEHIAQPTTHHPRHTTNDPTHNPQSHTLTKAIEKRSTPVLEPTLARSGCQNGPKAPETVEGPDVHRFLIDC